MYAKVNTCYSHQKNINPLIEKTLKTPKDETCVTTGYSKTQEHRGSHQEQMRRLRPMVTLTTHKLKTNQHHDRNLHSVILFNFGISHSLN